MKTIVLETDYATVWHYAEAGIVHHEFHRYIHGEQFRGVLERGLEIFSQRSATKWLSDDRKNSALPKVDAEWALNDWNPRVRAAGWKYWAIVMPDKKVGQMNMDWFIREGLKQGLTIQIFDDVDEALKWLESRINSAQTQRLPTLAATANAPADRRNRGVCDFCHDKTLTARRFKLLRIAKKSIAYLHPPLP
ncbi:MAG: hypothetical protein IPK19_24745 [Chloroflexi bacterium]|nr:hypothetical protein [Chloroflexota bacterium]